MDEWIRDDFLGTVDVSYVKIPNDLSADLTYNCLFYSNTAIILLYDNSPDREKILLNRLT